MTISYKQYQIISHNKDYALLKKLFNTLQIILDKASDKAN